MTATVPRLTKSYRWASARTCSLLKGRKNLQPQQEFLTTIGAWQWYIKAAQAATQVRYLLGERAKTKGETVKGEVKAARRATDLAVADLYKTINAMMDLMPRCQGDR